jgi:outer membrane biosynthesis protein TonB
MQHLTTPLELSAAAWRAAGYMMETNLRVAQVIGRAAIETNPFVFGTGLNSRPTKKAPVPKAKAKPTTQTAPSKPATTRKKATPKAKPAATAKTAKPETATVSEAKPKENAETSKRPRTPSKPPAMPDGSSATAKKPKTSVN